MQKNTDLLTQTLKLKELVKQLNDDLDSKMKTNATLKEDHQRTQYSLQGLVRLVRLVRTVGQPAMSQ